MASRLCPFPKIVLGIPPLTEEANQKLNEDFAIYQLSLGRGYVDLVPKHM